MNEQEFLKQKADLEKLIAYYESAKTTWGATPEVALEDAKRMLQRLIEKNKSKSKSKT